MRVDRAAALARIADIGVVPVIRAASSADALRIVDALLAGGLRIIEITMTVPGAIAVLADLSRRVGADVLLGAGTVTSPTMVEAAVDAGCSFVVTPCVVAEVIASARTFDLVCVGGALSPTEVFETHRAGADIVKVFPASLMGGPAYIRALRGPFPSIPLMATGGIGLEQVAEYFKAGVSAVGAGGELISKTAVAAGDYASISRTARAFVEAARDARR